MVLSMALSDSFLKSRLGKERDKIEEKSDRDGLWIRVSLKGSVTFFYRYRLNGKADKVTVGSYPAMGLKDARAEAARLSSLVANGDSPKHSKLIDDARRGRSFEKLYREWHGLLKTSTVTGEQILRTFEIHVFPSIGDIPASRITIHAWITVLERIAKSQPETAVKLISNAKRCYSWAKKRQLVDENPLIEINASDFGIKPKSVDRSLSAEEIAIVWNALDAGRMTQSNKDLIRLCLFYGCRVGELRLAERGHFDFDGMTWRVPPENHKTGIETKRPIIRPMNDFVAEIVKRRMKASPGKFIFSSKEMPLKASAHVGVINAMNVAICKKNADFKTFTMHDLRRTARTMWSNITEPHVAEVMLGHKLPGVWSVYDRHDYMEEMRLAYDKWLAKLMAIVNPDVIEFKRPDEKTA
jgi:integrase